MVNSMFVAATMEGTVINAIKKHLHFQQCITVNSDAKNRPRYLPKVSAVGIAVPQNQVQITVV